MTYCDVEMHSPLVTFIDRLDNPWAADSDVIRWGAPVPSFGDLYTSEVATVGLNPSNREFLDEMGRELKEGFRRFHSLTSLGIKRWSDADAAHLAMILDSCRSYFFSNPYNRWFKALDRIVAGAKTSFYDTRGNACHLDLIPYATGHKWGELAARQRSALLSAAGDSLAILLRDAPIRILILNGKSVVQHFEAIAGIQLVREPMRNWSLPRTERTDIGGVAYKGTIHTLSGVELRQQVLVLGYNHNVQSSFGVTAQVIAAIRDWVSRAVEDICR